MAKTGKFDLINEFCEEQKENDIIILTTYKFGAPFFDIYLLDRILENNPSADIFILMDGNEYEQNYETFTKHTGRGYHLIPIFCRKGVFHPKLSLFYSETNSKATAYIGSCNVTLAGFTSNAEVITKIESDLDPVDSVVETSVNYFELLINKKYVVSPIFEKAVKEMIERIKNPFKNEDVLLFHNLELPILTQLSNQNVNPVEATLLAPFWSNNASVIQELNKSKKLQKLNILIQENNHNLTHPEKYETYCKEQNIKINFSKAKFEKNRMFHSKIIVLDSRQPWALLGSSNMTESALLKSADEGNFEVSVLLKSDIKAIMNEIKIDKIKDLESIKAETIEYVMPLTKETVKVYCVDFDMINRTLKLILHKEKAETKIVVIFEDKSKEVFRISDQEIVQIHCEKIPFEVIITQGAKTARRRVFYDVNYFYKKVTKGSITFSDINRKIFSDYKINAIDLLRLLSGLNMTTEQNEPYSTSKEKKQKDESTKHFHLPSKEIDSYHNKKILQNFVELYKLMTAKKQEDREIEESAEIEEKSNKKVSVAVQRIIDEQEEKQRICGDILDSINELLVFKAKTEKNPSEAIVASTPLLVQSIIKILAPIYVDSDLLDQAKEYINENLEGIPFGEVSFEIRKNLFFSLVMLNYYFEYKVHYSFLSNLFKVEEVFDHGFINECLAHISSQVSELRPKEKILKEVILEYAGHLCSYIPNSSNVEEESIKSLNLITRITDDNAWAFSKSYLETLLKMWSINNSWKEDIRKAIKGYNSERKEFIEHLLGAK